MLKDLSVSGEGLVVKETVRMLGQVSGVGVASIGSDYRSVVSCARFTTIPCHLFCSSAALFR